MSDNIAYMISKDKSVTIAISNQDCTIEAFTVYMYYKYIKLRECVACTNIN